MPVLLRMAMSPTAQKVTRSRAPGGILASLAGPHLNADWYSLQSALTFLQPVCGLKNDRIIKRISRRGSHYGQPF